MKYLYLSIFIFIWGSNYAQSDKLKYQTPPKSIVDLADASIPRVQFSKDGKYMLILESPGFETLEQVSQPIIGLAGLKVNPANSSLEPENAGSYTGMKVKDLKTGITHEIQGLPTNGLLTRITWSPDNTLLAFAHKTTSAIELWIADMASYTARKLTNQKLNALTGTPIQWHPSGQYLLIQTIPADRGPAPLRPLVPDGPVIQENLGIKTPSRTYQYLLNDDFDEQLMDYYLTSTLQQISLDGRSTPIYQPAIFRSVNYSPDGKYILVQTTEHPYSYLVPINYFPNKSIILEENGRLVKELHQAPLADKIPIAFDAVAPGPRSYQWRKDLPSTLYWVEAQDGGNPNEQTEFKDAIFCLSAPFNGQKQKVFSTRLRYGGMEWINKDYALVRENLRRTRRSVLTLIHPDKGTVIKEIENRSSEDTYSDPGRFVRSNADTEEGTLLLDNLKNLAVFTIGNGASPKGDRPFVMRWELLTGKRDTLFKSKAPYYEQPVFFNNTGFLFISRESVDDAPNYFSIQLKGKKKSETALTDFPDPYAALKGVSKTQLSYPRKDGITLTGTLYLPKDYKKENGRLPVLVWAYPREYKTAEAAGQVKGSPYRFTRISWGSPVYWVTRGYAVVDNADMPIVGTGSTEPNDSFVEQITDNAHSLINYIVDLGIADRKRIAVGGHSYGAFMTANLLAHTDLFAAGLARSGAYNRTLTPFGFQNETRTYWQAPEIYYNMSPFSFADKIKTPILFIHGIDDDNSGTFPIQSERLYSAVKGHGGTARLVMLPKEFHGYRSRESILHTLWEQDQWLEKYVKNRE